MCMEQVQAYHAPKFAKENQNFVQKPINSSPCQEERTLGCHAGQVKRSKAALNERFQITMIVPFACL